MWSYPAVNASQDWQLWYPPRRALCAAGETLLRKLDRSDMLKKQSVPEIVFAYFHNK
jgi:hypothetical protein